MPGLHPDRADCRAGRGAEYRKVTTWCNGRVPRTSTGSGGGCGGGRVGPGGEKLDRYDRIGSARHWRQGTEGGETLTQIHLNRRGLRRANSRHQLLLRRWWKRRVERVGVDTQKQPSLLLCHRCRGSRANLERHTQRRRTVVVLRRDPRHAQIADDEQTRRGAEVELDVVDGSERATDEFDGDEPSVAAPRQWS